jgi:hypothetical protein
MRWLIKGEQMGGHVHVGIWAGTQAQADAKARPKLGFLIMDDHEWRELVELVEVGNNYTRAEFDIEGPGVL